MAERRGDFTQVKLDLVEKWEEDEEIERERKERGSYEAWVREAQG